MTVSNTLDRQPAARPKRPYAWFEAQAAFDALLGVDLLLFGRWIADHLLAGPVAAEAETLLRVAGAVLIVIALDIVWILRRAETGFGQVLLSAVAPANAVCAIAIAGTLIVRPDWFTGLGMAAMLAVILVLALFAVRQPRALRSQAR